jgi:hypothetical protein
MARVERLIDSVFNTVLLYEDNGNNDTNNTDYDNIDNDNIDNDNR